MKKIMFAAAVLAAGFAMADVTSANDVGSGIQSANIVG